MVRKTPLRHWAYILVTIKKNVKNLNKIDKIKTLFFSWGKRNLTILGKIIIIKALVIPIFTFVARACVVPAKYRK
jgi:hypothetical protein